MRVLPFVFAVLAALPSPSATVQPETGPGALRFLAPRDLSTVLGPASFILGVDPPEGTTVVRIDVSLDGKPLTTLTSPPWSGEWNAGETGGNHRLVARAL